MIGARGAARGTKVRGTKVRAQRGGRRSEWYKGKRHSVEWILQRTADSCRRGSARKQRQHASAALPLLQSSAALPLLQSSAALPLLQSSAALPLLQSSAALSLSFYKIFSLSKKNI